MAVILVDMLARLPRVAVLTTTAPEEQRRANVDNMLLDRLKRGEGSEMTIVTGSKGRGGWPLQSNTKGWMRSGVRSSTTMTKK
jgi:hypothetical protein